MQTTDFQLDVDGVGQYVFRRRRIGDVFRIRSLYAQLTGGHYDENGNMADVAALAFATIRVMAVSEPDGFKLENIDPIFDSFDEKLIRVYFELIAKERSFRPGPAKNSAGARSGDGEDVRPVVPEDVPAGTD